MLNDDLKNCEHGNVALQAQRDVHQAELQKCQDTITHLKTRYVPHARNPGKTTLSRCTEAHEICQQQIS